MSCCDPNQSNQNVPDAPEFQRPYNFIPSCNSCGDMFTWIDKPVVVPEIVEQPVILIERNTR
jgi:hypothetical protein